MWAGRCRRVAWACGLGLLWGTARAEDTSGLWADTRAVVEAGRGETLAALLGRWLVRARWEEVLTETLFLIAPRGAWDDRHPAWAPARLALSTALRRASAERLREPLGELVHDIVRDHAPSDPAERAQALAFYTSPGGKAWLDSRERFLREQTWGLPFVVEAEPRATVARAAAAAKKTLLHLPAAQTSAVYEFTHTPLGERLLAVQNGMIAEATANCMRSELLAIVIEERDALVRAVRAAVRGIPPPTDKTYVGTVRMRADRTFDLEIEQFDGLQKSGTYQLSYAPGALHWADVSAAVPDIPPGETRFLYVDPLGRLSEKP